jgi:predicted nucleotide-binding protein
MRIGIIGGWGESDSTFTLRQTRDEFEAFCRALGRRLGQAGQAIIVGSDEPVSADTHVVAGMLETAAPTVRPLITVIRSRAGPPSFAEAAASRPDLLTTVRRKADDKAAAKMIAIQEADAVVTIAGFTATLHAGIGALYSAKRVVPVPVFGGASASLLEIVEQAQFDREAMDYGQLEGPVGNALVDRVLQIAGVGRRRKVMIIHGHAVDDRVRLGRWLEPRCESLLMIDDVNVGAGLPEKFETLANEADAAIALATPDDLPSRASCGDSQARARQNVWVEVGWFWGRRGRSRVMLLTRGAIEIPSDYAGVETFPYQNDPTELAPKLEIFLDSLERR